MLKRAAELQGRTMTDFVVAAVQEAAQRAIEQAGIVRCSLADQECFAQALLVPPQPNLALERAYPIAGYEISVSSLSPGNGGVAKKGH